MDSKDALEISRKVAKYVLKAVQSLRPEDRGMNVGMGKDGTPTKMVDRVAEDAALQVLRKEKLTIVTEESGIVGEGDVHVALDPLDGTFNAAVDIPIYSVSLCFSDSQKFGDSFFAYVFNLAKQDEYYADEKALKNGREIRVSPSNSLYCNAIVYYPHLYFPFKRMRVLGSASLELCFVADASFDCFIDIRKGEDGRGILRIYDVAAGAYIAEKAGATVTDDRGNSLKYRRFEMEERLRVVAANSKLHHKLMELIS
jgi:myo-inositol-1(or 4)-monophosphatase